MNFSHDELLEKFAAQLNDRQSRDDDALILSVGAPGVGKSVFNLHLATLVGKESFDMNCVGFDTITYKKALNYVKDLPGHRVALNDEANIGRRDSMAKKNKNMIDMFLAIRGLNIVHLWCNPSAELMEKYFIKERILGIFLIRKSKKWTNARYYFYFPQKSLLQILEKYKTLNISLMDKVRRKYSLFCGWFRDYTGPLKEDYLKMKEERMHYKIANLDLGDKEEEIQETLKDAGLNNKLQTTYTYTFVGRALSTHPDTVRKYVMQMIQEKNMIENEDYILNLRGVPKMTTSGIKKLKEYVVVKGDKYGFEKTKSIAN